MALRIFVLKPAAGANTDDYQLQLKANSRAGALIHADAQSALADFKDEHKIDLSHVDLTGISKICLCATGAWDGFDASGIAYIEYV